MLKVSIDVREVPARSPEQVPLMRLSLPFEDLLEMFRIAKDHPDLRHQSLVETRYEMLKRLEPCQDATVSETLN